MDEISEISDELTRLSLETGGDAMSIATSLTAVSKDKEEDETATIADVKGEAFEFDDDDNDEWVYVTPVTAVRSHDQEQWMVVTQPESTFIPPELLDCDDNDNWDPSTDNKDLEWDPPSLNSDILDKISTIISSDIDQNGALLHSNDETILQSGGIAVQQQQHATESMQQHQQLPASYMHHPPLDTDQLLTNYQMLLLQHQQILALQQQKQQQEATEYYITSTQEYDSNYDNDFITIDGSDPNLLLAQHHNFCHNWGDTGTQMQNHQQQQDINQQQQQSSRSTNKSPSPTSRNVIQDMRFIANFTPNLTRAADATKEKNLQQFSQQLDWEFIPKDEKHPSVNNKKRRSSRK